MSAFLLEIGTEELPAAFVVDAQKKLCDALADLLSVSNIGYSSMHGMSTPRRLAVIVDDIALVQQTTNRKIKGPPVASSFEADGSPKATAQGFAAKNNLTVDQLEHEQYGAVMHLVANVVTEGKLTADVLQANLPKLISHLSGDRMMRWASSDFKFSRPIRWVVALLNEEVVPFVVNDVISGRKSFGHRILHPAAIVITHPDSYAKKLEAGFVQVDPVLRKKKIEAEVIAAAGALKGRPRRLTSTLLDEVVNITEWPCAVSGDFAQEYLDLPDALIETVMVHHQKYFPVESQISTTEDALNTNRLLPHFITVSNNDLATARPFIKQGNERVLKARLADGRFFYFDDQKVKLSDRKEVVAQLTFQEGLGSYGDKVSRMVRTAQAMSSRWHLNAEVSVPLERTLELCKSDLVTSLVRELPELQGHVGSWYAKQEGQPIEVVRAIASHYAPRFTEDQIPADKVGQLASIIDKSDTLVGLFLIGKKPTGSSDPYAMRRQAQGLVDVLMDEAFSIPVDITELFEQSLLQYEALKISINGPIPAEKLLTELNEFLVQRVKTRLAAASTRREVSEAAIGPGKLRTLSSINARVKAVNELLDNVEGIELIRAGIRIANILKNSANEQLDPALFSEDAEHDLWNFYNKSIPAPDGIATTNIPNSVQQLDLKVELNRLSRLVAPINNFFLQVMVNDDDQKKRANRHALLQLLNNHFLLVADFTKLQPIIA